MSIYFFPSKTYFDCPFINTSGRYTKVYVTVNKYFGGVRYTLNEYKLSQCSFDKRSHLLWLDTVYCSNGLKDKEWRYISFNIIDGSINEVSSFGFPYYY